MRSLVSRRDEDGVLRLLLEVWAQERPAPIASAIGALSDRFVLRCPPLLVLQPWLQKARSLDPLHVAALLVPGRDEGVRVFRKKLQALEPFPPDPRIAAFAQDLPHALQPGPRDQGAYRELLARVALRHGGPSEVSTPEHEQLAGFALSLPPSLEQQLLNEVYASPREEGLRHVYHDYLESLGLRLPRPIPRHYLQGIRDPLDHWWRHRMMGERAPALVELSGVFPRRAVLGHPPPRLTPAWSTLEELELDQQHFDWLASVTLPHLSHLVLVGAYPLQGPLSFPGLRPRIVTLPWSWWRPVSRAEAEPWSQLELLRLVRPDPQRPLDAATLGEVYPRTVALNLPHFGPPACEQVWALAGAAAPSVRCLQLEPNPQSHLRFERGESGRFEIVRVKHWNVPEIVQWLAPLPHAEVQLLELDTAPVAWLPQNARSFERFPRVEVSRAR